MTNLDEVLLAGSHDTAVIGWDKQGNVCFLKTYFYDKQTEEAQTDLKKIIDLGLAWRIGHVSLINFAGEANEED